MTFLINEIHFWYETALVVIKSLKKINLKMKFTHKDNEIWVIFLMGQKCKPNPGINLNLLKVIFFYKMFDILHVLVIVQKSTWNT